MPLKWFIEGDKKFEIEDVLSGKVQMEGFPLPYLKAVGKERKWDGHLHVTDLFNGKRETYLKYTTFYAIDPDKQAFAIIGSMKHDILEDPNNPFHEKEIIYRDIKGKLDLLNPQINGEYWLDDYKAQGGYAVRKFMGWQKKYVPIVDEFGVQVCLKSGKNKGKPKTKGEWFLDPETADKAQYEWQLNIYRAAIEESLEIEISRLNIFFMLRDGGLAATKDQGLDKNTYYLQVKILNNKLVDDYIDSRSDTKENILNFRATERLSPEERWDALKKNCPPMCSEKERWHNPETGKNTKCEMYCSVSELCGRIN